MYYTYKWRKEKLETREKVIIEWGRQSHKKSAPPNQKIFFHYKLQDLRVFWTFEQLSIACGARVMLTQSHVRSGCFVANCLI